jgi:hypothetical protein
VAIQASCPLRQRLGRKPAFGTLLSGEACFGAEHAEGETNGNSKNKPRNFHNFLPSRWTITQNHQCTPQHRLFALQQHLEAAPILAPAVRDEYFAMDFSVAEICTNAAKSRCVFD